jgi:hypothetical protein
MDTSLLEPINTFLARESMDSRLLQALIIFGLTMLLLFLFNQLIRRVTPKVNSRTESMTTAENVLKIRRAETIIGLVITLIRVVLIVAAILTMWHIINGGTAPIALIGIGTVAIILASATIVPLLRDMTYGFIIIVERWYGLGDHVVIEPFTSSGGIVEKMTLRATKIRNVNGEAIWWHHQHIQGVRVTSAAAHPLVVEIFVNDPDKGKKIIEEATKIIPSSAITVPQPLEISEVKQVSDTIWRITAICEVTPFREWIIDNFAIKVIKKTDTLLNEEPVIVHGPIAYYADSTAEKRYRRSATVRQRIRSGTKKKS